MKMCPNPSIILVSVLTAASFRIPLANAVNCGEVNLARPLIIAGSDTVRGEWPFAVALFRIDNGKYFCGGTLISHKHILTAAHCVQTKNSYNVRSADNVLVHLGAHNLSSSDENGTVRRRVSQIDVHEDWNAYSQTYDADLAILTLSKHIAFSDFIKPVCIPSVDETIGTMLNFKGYIIGWAPSNRSRVETPRHAMTTILNATYCFEVDPNLAHFSSQRTFCGWDENGFPDTGDSGGGLVVLSGSAWVQVGIISATRANGTGHVIPQMPAIYTNTRLFRDWIVQKTNGAVSVASGMKIVLKCSYIYYREHYACIVHDLDIKNQHHAVFKFVGAHLPSKSERHVEVISFYNGTMLYLPDEIGKSFPNLKMLATTRVGTLKLISRTSFKNLENLTKFFCQDSKLEVIEEESLWDLSNLEVFVVNDNLIEILYEKTFTSNPKLKSLNFMYNAIQYLPKDLFKNNLLLEEIDFSYNFLFRIDSQFRDMPNIKEISFHENECISATYDANSTLAEFNNLIVANCTSIPASDLYRFKVIHN